MLGQIRIQRGATLYSAAVMLADFLQGRQTSVVHVRRGDGDIAKRRGCELSQVRVLARNLASASVLEFRVETVVRKGLALKQRATVTMKAVGSEQLTTWIKFGREQFKPALLGVT